MKLIIKDYKESKDELELYMRPDGDAVDILSSNDGDKRYEFRINSDGTWRKYAGGQLADKPKE